MLKEVFLVSPLDEQEAGPSTSQMTIKKEEPPEDVKPFNLIPLTGLAEELASLVAVSGDAVEVLARDNNRDEDQLL